MYKHSKNSELDHDTFMAKIQMYSMSKKEIIYTYTGNWLNYVKKHIMAAQYIPKLIICVWFQNLVSKKIRH